MTDSDERVVTWKPLPGAHLIEVCDVGGLVRKRYIPRPVAGGRTPRDWPPMPLPSRKSGTSRYWQIAYTDDAGARRKRPVHTLVLEAHRGLRPPGMEGCHNDGDLNNNDLANLRWDTRAANRADRWGMTCQACGGTGRVPVTDSHPDVVAEGNGLRDGAGDSA